ncbi:MAG: hypothetical protein VYD05_12845 [Planctomycetota bacterium]|nr:hypothetical protein [Planctomycetota bacterium]
MTAWAITLRVLAGVAMIAYPVIVWIGFSSGSPRGVAIILLSVMTPAMLLRSRSAAPTNRVRGLAAVPATILAVLLAAALMDGADYILVTPVAANAVLLASFGVTLRRRSMPMIERFARLQEATLSDQQRAWCRLWTKIWCAFFATNGATAALLAAYGDLAAWAFYNGLLAYALIGALFALEWTLRRRRFPTPPRSTPPDETR